MRSHFTLIAIFLTLVISFSYQLPLSPDSKRLYHNIVSGRGLYNERDKITPLNATSFRPNVVDSKRSWLVEFYNSWCGHCQRFAPLWKTLAASMYGWRDTVAVSAVDCSIEFNNQLCRDYEIMSYPSIKYFPADNNISIDFTKGDPVEMRNNLLKILQAEQLSNYQSNRPNLIAFSGNNFNDLWKMTPQNVINTILVVQPDDSFLGQALAMDLFSMKDIQVIPILSSNRALLHILNTSIFPSVYILNRDMKFLNVNSSSQKREDLYKAIKESLAERAIPVPDLPPVDESVNNSDVDIAEVMQVMLLEEQLLAKVNSKNLSGIVFQLDLEGALRYALNHELTSHKVINGTGLIAMKELLDVLVLYFPIDRQGVKFLVKLRDFVNAKNSEINGDELFGVLKSYEEEFHPFLDKQGWIACRGSKPSYRGYPCALWSTFHTLTVHGALRNTDIPANPRRIIEAIRGYVKHFFGCSDCAQHFEAMASTITDDQMGTLNDSILWLWNAHNKVNARLSGDISEDPEHLKVQFPPPELCPTCRDADNNWNHTNVLLFLNSMYSNISYLQLIPTTTKSPGQVYLHSMRHYNFGEETGFNEQTIQPRKAVSWDFNVFDISLCVSLYIFSVAILILVCIKFLFRKTYRKKVYIYDLLNKV